MSKIPKRQKVQPRLHTERELQEAAKKACEAAAKYNVYFTLGAMCIALHEMYGFSKGRLMPLLNRISDLTFEALSPSELVERARRETGVKIKDYEEEQREFL